MATHSKAIVLIGKAIVLSFLAKWRDEIENLYGLRVCAIIQVILVHLGQIESEAPLSDSLSGVRVQNDQNRVKLIFGVVMSLASAWAMRGQCVGNAWAMHFITRCN